MPIATASYTITWEKLPDDFPLPDEPVDNIDQPSLAAALSPQYVIFEPQQGVLEVYQLNDLGRYDLQQPNANHHYKIEALDLCLGVWQGIKGNRTGYWLRWWDESGQLLPWGVESVEQERQRAEQERQRAEVLAAQLRAAGIEPQL